MGQRVSNLSRGGRADKFRAAVGRRKFKRGRLETCCPFQGHLGSKWRGARDPPGKSQPRR